MVRPDRQGLRQSPAAQKAAGAQARLDSVGKAIALSGKGLTGGAVDLAKYRGKVVLIQYWATWCEPAKADMAALKELMKQYGGSFAVIGVNLDTDPKDLNAYLAETRCPGRRSTKRAAWTAGRPTSWASSPCRR